MKHLAQRARSFLNRTSWLGHYLPGGYAQAVIHLAKIKLSPQTKGKGLYKDLSFMFAPRDMSAIKEVLEDGEYKFLEPVLKITERPVIVDAGSHIGLFALWAFGHNQKSRIFSIEASPKTFATTKANCESARTQGYDWQVLHAAAWSGPGVVSFYNDGETMGHHISATSGNIQVSTVTFQEIMSRISQEYDVSDIDILKVDIEGAEEAFLIPGEEFLPNVRNLVIELHPGKCDTDKVISLLSRHYSSVVNCEDRASRKPLLYCHN